MNKLSKALFCAGFALCCGAQIANSCDISVSRSTKVLTDENGVPTSKMLACAFDSRHPKFKEKIKREFCNSEKIEQINVDRLLKKIATEGVVRSSEDIVDAIVEAGDFDKFYAAIDPKNQKKYGTEPSINDILGKIKKLVSISGDREEKINEIIQIIKKSKESLGRMTIFLIDDYLRSLSMLKDSEKELRSMKPKSWEREKWENQLSSLQRKMDNLFSKTLRTINENINDLSAPESDEVRREFSIKSIKSDPSISNLLGWMKAKRIKPFIDFSKSDLFADLIEICGGRVSGADGG